MFLPSPRVKLSIVGSLCDREVAYSASDRQGSIFESCVWRTVSSHSSHHPQEVLLPSLVHICGLQKKLHCVFTHHVKERLSAFYQLGLLFKSEYYLSIYVYIYACIDIYIYIRFMKCSPPPPVGYINIITYAYNKVVFRRFESLSWEINNNP